jgi:PAS domain S-box-containing protein
MENDSFKILSIDGDEVLLDNLKSLIGRIYPEASFSKSGSGERGIEICDSLKPDVVLTGMTSADISGNEFCTRLKSNNLLRNIPVILMTSADSDRKSRLDAFLAGADALLTSPPDDVDLMIQIRSALRLKRSEDMNKEEKQILEKAVRERTGELEIELADRKKAERKLIHSLDKQTRNRRAIMNLLEDLKSEMYERKMVENNLQLERNLLRTLIDSLPDTVYIMDREGRKVVSNKADVQYIGLNSESEVIGKTDIDLFPGETGKSFHQLNMSVIESGKPIIEFEENFVDLKGEKRWLMSSQFPLYDSDGKVSGLLGTGHDVTERKRKDEALERKNKELEFLNNLATELASLEPHENMNSFLMKQLKKLSGSEFIVFSEYDSTRKSLYTKHIEAENKILNNLIKITGHKIVNSPSPILMNDKNYHEIISSIVSSKNSLTEISFGAIPKLIDKAFRTLTGIDHYLGLSYVVAGELYGTSLLGLKKDDLPPSDELLKSFAYVAAVSMRRRKAEKELFESEDRYRVLIENQGEGVAIVDLSDNFVFANPAAEEMFGVSGGKLVNRRLTDFTNIEELRKIQRETVKNESQEKSTYELNIKTPEGISRTLLVTGTSQFGDDKTRTGTFVVFRDITERKKLLEKITESEAYYRTLVDISPDGILTTDMEGSIKFCSNKIFSIFDISDRSQVIGKSILDFVHPDSHTIIMERVSDVLNGKMAPETSEFKLLKGNGRVFWGELSSSPLPNPNTNSLSLMIICRDITERKLAEEELIRSRDKAEESDRLKTAFLHNISHEIRTPMNAINGFSALLSEPDLDAESQRSFIDVITHNSNQLLNVVSDIIEISNIEAGLLRTNKRDIMLNETLASIVESYQARAKEKGLKFSYKFGLTNNHAILTIDSEKLIQVLTNLLSNAIKFTLNGSVEFCYEIKNGFLEFSVTDTGIGISPELHTRIFERFYQVDNAMVRQYEGTGLGLSISKAYVEIMGGTIWIESVPGKGSIFRFTVPYSESSKKVIAEIVTPEVEKKMSKEKRKILIAEDEEINYLLIGKLLSSLNAEIIHAWDGKEAVKICESDRDIDLVLMDIKMPVMDGHEATAEIRKILPDLPVIALTAYAFSVDREKAIVAGCNDYLSKPVKRDTLLAMVNSYLGTF